MGGWGGHALMVGPPAVATVTITDSPNTSGDRNTMKMSYRKNNPRSATATRRRGMRSEAWKRRTSAIPKMSCSGQAVSLGSVDAGGPRVGQMGQRVSTG